MLSFICPLAFCWVSIQISNAKPLKVARLEADLVSKTPIKFIEMDRGNEQHKDSKEIEQFVNEVIMCARVLYPGKDYSMITLVLLADQKQNDALEKNKKEMPDWLIEIAKIKEAIEKENGTQWANLLRKLQQIMDKAMSALNKGESVVQNDKFENLKNEIMEAAKEMAILCNISLDEKNHSLEHTQKNMLKEMALLWNEFKTQNEKKGQNSDEKRANGKRTKRMLQVALHFPIDVANGLVKFKKPKNSGRRRRRKVSLVKVAIYAPIICLVLALFVAMGMHLWGLWQEADDDDIEAARQEEHNQGQQGAPN